jgi:hypothetical protein
MQLTANTRQLPSQQAYRRVGELFTAGGTGTDFLMHDVASPDLSLFLNDVLKTYRWHGVTPVLRVHSVIAALCHLRIESGHVGRNRSGEGGGAASLSQRGGGRARGGAII